MFRQRRVHLQNRNGEFQVLKDASLFPIHFFDCDMFCEICVQLRKFKIFSQNHYNKTYGKNEIPPNKPLFCKCEVCGEPVIYATDEFAELLEEPTLGLCKIWGKANLMEGDLVFLENEKLCSVEMVNRVSGSLPQVTLRKQDNEKVDIKVDFRGSAESGADKLYRLIPQDAQNARIGDLVYHTELKQTGKTIGLEFNDNQRIIVKFENEEISIVNVENNAHYLTDKILGLNTTWRCKDLPYFKDVRIFSESKVLHVNCKLPSLKAVRELENIISSIPQVRCFIMHTLVKNSNIDSNDIYRELIRNCVSICNCRIEFKNQEVFISGFYSDKSVPESVYKTLSRFPIRKINLELKKRFDIKNCKTINKKDAFIRISKIGKETHIDGWVEDDKDRQRAKIKAFFYSFNFKIENHLLVMG
ncbi:MAG: hypothetical protein LBH25_02945 [Fibromonadaceae bacterium]|jgi:hypothetical protein|nr:hypothetical protein [Fibromonadaceae bacterium]